MIYIVYGYPEETKNWILQNLSKIHKDGQSLKIIQQISDWDLIEFHYNNAIYTTDKKIPQRFFCEKCQIVKLR